MIKNINTIIQGSFPGGMPYRTALLISAQPSCALGFQPPLNKNTFTKTPYIIQKSGIRSFQINASRINLSSEGFPLPDNIIQPYENLFDTDFSDVKIHTGGYQAESIGALAFTSGNNIYFANGRYNPGSADGRRLLGHELAHVVQQKKGFVKSPFEKGISVVNDPRFEAEAERFGLKSTAAFKVIQRQATNFFSGIIQLGKKKVERIKKRNTKTKSKAKVSDPTYGNRIKTKRKFRPTKEEAGSKRIIKVTGPLKSTSRGRKGKRKFKSSNVSDPLNNFLSKAGITPEKLTFEGGHLIGDVFDGPTSENNILPMPSNFNRVAYKKEENKIKKILKGTKNNPLNNSSSMEMEIVYPKNSLKGLINEKGIEKLKKEVSNIQFEKLEKLLEKVPSKIKMTYNVPSGSKKVIFSEIRNDLLTKTDQKKVVTNDFIDAVKNL